MADRESHHDQTEGVIPAPNLKNAWDNQALEAPESIAGITPEYGLDLGIEAIIEQVETLLSVGIDPVIVEIAGGSASGKTSAVADKIIAAFAAEATLLSMDDYYRGGKFMEAEAAAGRLLTWDEPAAVNIGLFREHLRLLKLGHAIEKPLYDFKSGEMAGTETVMPGKVVVVEGLFALSEEITEFGDVKVFVDIDTHGRIIRRLLRDVIRTGQKPKEILNYFAEVVEPMHRLHIERTRQAADLIVSNGYRPEVEAMRSGLTESQLKFPSQLSPEVLRRAGAKRLEYMFQVDRYYNAPGRNLALSEEMLRIREQDNKRILTYKGPRIDSPYRKRPKFEFEIDAETEAAFLAIYGNLAGITHKHRTFYTLDGTTFCLDEVVALEENGSMELLGQFLELRTAEILEDAPRLSIFIEKLHLDPAKATKQAYIDIPSIVAHAAS